MQANAMRDADARAETLYAWILTFDTLYIAVVALL